MSDYDRRTWQRPRGERTADPEWEDEIAAVADRPAKRRGIAVKGSKAPIAGNHGRRGLRRLLANAHPLAAPDKPDKPDIPDSDAARDAAPDERSAR